MKKYFFIWIFISIILSGCAHYFQKNAETKLEENVFKIDNICIRKGTSLEDSIVLEVNDYKFGNIYNLVEKKYRITNACDQKKSDLQVVIIDQEKEQWGDWWKVSLGIIPGVYAKTWNVRIYNSENKLILDRQLNGKLVISIFFAPFFFLHKDPDQIVFDELDKFLQGQIKSKRL